MRKDFLRERVEAVEVRGSKSISKLLAEMKKTGFQGRKLGEVVDVWEKMLREPELTIILGYAGSLSTTGQWKIVKWLIENRFIDVLVATGANISEDVHDAMGHGYYRGSHMVDDYELYKRNIFRYYDVFTDGAKYRQMTELIRRFVKTLKEGYAYSSREFCYLFGKYLAEKGLECILSAAFKEKIPVFSPSIMDSEYGIAAVLARRKDRKMVVVDQVKDFDEFALMGEKSKNTAAIYIGGGVPKDYTQLLTTIVALLRGEDLDRQHKYAIQITADSPQWGGLSGCTLEEAVSWGKIAKDADKVVCYCDATIALPIVTHALAERFSSKRNAPDFSGLFE